ncbi:MAG: YHYH domain-containing protein [Rhodospirillaceae bacterium]|nr:YHYH domain-containing protein [Rhodospirillaceae bacterium]
MRKRLTAIITGICFLIAPLPAFAHGGGLNRDGCHNVTATGGYHCHRGRDDEDDVDWGTIGIVVGGLVLLAVVARVMTGQKGLSLTDTNAADRRMGVTPYLARNDAIGLDAYYNLNPSSRLGVRVMSDENGEEQGVAAGATWNLRF